jgi:hypothetical protein
VAARYSTKTSSAASLKIRFGRSNEPLDVREPIRSGPFVRYNDMLALEFVDAM